MRTLYALRIVSILEWMYSGCSRWYFRLHNQRSLADGDGLPQEQDTVVCSHLVIANNVTNLQPDIPDEGQYGISTLRMSVHFPALQGSQGIETESKLSARAGPGRREQPHSCRREHIGLRFSLPAEHCERSRSCWKQACSQVLKGPPGLLLSCESPCPRSSAREEDHLLHSDSKTGKAGASISAP